jgi:hypothetical protein
MAVAFVALLAALSGTAIALPGTGTVDSGDIKNSTIRSKDVRNNNLRGRDVRNRSLTGTDVRDDSLTGADINESTLGQVPSANSANTANSANFATNAGDADKLDGKNSTDFLPTSGTAPTGTLLTGVLNVSAGHGGGTPSPAGTLGTEDISFGVQFASAPAYRYVESGQTGPAECNAGTASAPDAAAGFVCVYEQVAVNETQISANEPAPQGVTLFIRATAAGEAFVIASWAARAP